MCILLHAMLTLLSIDNTFLFSYIYLLHAIFLPLSHAVLPEA